MVVPGFHFDEKFIYIKMGFGGIDFVQNGISLGGFSLLILFQIGCKKLPNLLFGFFNLGVFFDGSRHGDESVRRAVFVGRVWDLHAQLAGVWEFFFYIGQGGICFCGGGKSANVYFEIGLVVNEYRPVCFRESLFGFVEDFCGIHSFGRKAHENAISHDFFIG